MWVGDILPGKSVHVGKNEGITGTSYEGKSKSTTCDVLKRSQEKARSEGTLWRCESQSRGSHMWGMAHFHSPIACDFLNRSQQRSRPKEHFDVNSNPWDHKWGEGFLPSRPPSAGVIFFDVSSSKFLKSSAWALSRSAENDHVIPGKTNSRLPSKTGICHGSRIDPLRASLHYHHSTISESTEEVHLACPGHCPANGTIFPVKSPISFRW